LQLSLAIQDGTSRYTDAITPDIQLVPEPGISAWAMALAGWLFRRRRAAGNPAHPIRKDDAANDDCQKPPKILAKFSRRDISVTKEKGERIISKTCLAGIVRKVSQLARFRSTGRNHIYDPFRSGCPRRAAVQIPSGFGAQPARADP
jgi:uncharacterized protein (TIGR03382 family)